MALVGAQFVNAVSPNPVGSLQAFAGASAPTGWLLCDGSQQAISTYPELYSVLGTTYGALTNGSGGAGSTHFRVPDLRGRIPLGAGSGTQNGGSGSGVITGGTALTARTIGQFGGDERLATHNHGVTDPGHTHGHYEEFGNNSVNVGPGGNYSTHGGYGPYYGRNTTNTTGISIQNNANGGSGGNMPPFVVTNYIIKAIPDAPRSGLAYGSTPPIVTALPANPQFGDVVTYIADATNGVAWNLQYDATGTYPWKFIGGAALYAFGGGGATNSTSYVDCGGASMTIALPGDYVFDYKCHFQLAAGESGFISCFFGTTATDANGSIVYGSSANIDVESGRTTRQTIATAGSTVKTQNRMGSVVSRNFTNQTLLATPIRVKAA